MQTPLDLVRLRELMNLTQGDAAVQIALIDGPVCTTHSAFAEGHLKLLREGAACTSEVDAACIHGTFVAGIISANRGAQAPGICPGCTLLIFPIFLGKGSCGFEMPGAPARELASAITSCVNAGANVINLSVAPSRTSLARDQGIESALDFAAAKNVIVVAATGNEGALGSTSITRHPWVVPVAACDASGRPLTASNLAHSIATRGLRAPGESITGLNPDGGVTRQSGTSAAVPFVSGTIALLWSLKRGATAASIRHALLSSPERTRSIVPPLLDSWSAYGTLNRLLERNRENRTVPGAAETGKGTAAWVSAR